MSNPKRTLSDASVDPGRSVRLDADNGDCSTAEKANLPFASGMWPGIARVSLGAFAVSACYNAISLGLDPTP